MYDVPPSRLISPEARRIQEVLATLPASDPLTRITALRRALPESDAELVAAVATQARLRERARPRLGPWADELVLSDAGLQQATRADVARHRATSLRNRLSSLARPGSHERVADLGCGLGIDSLALAEAGFEVLAVEQDPWTAEAAAANSRRYDSSITVQCADARDIDLSGSSAAFCDPSRRTTSSNAQGSRGRRVTSPDEWSPPWSWVTALAGRMPVVAKAAPGLSAARVPADAEIEWIDADGELVEACVWFAPLAGPSRRRATVLVGGRAESIVAAATTSESTTSVHGFLVEPSPAVRRAGLVDELATRLDVARLSTEGAWLTSDTAPQTALAQSWRVLGEVPADPRELRATIADRGSVTWKTRDIGISAEDMDARVGHRAVRGGAAITIAWVRTSRGSVAVEVAPSARG